MADFSSQTFYHNFSLDKGLTGRHLALSWGKPPNQPSLKGHAGRGFVNKTY
jgi:hypothetical protein